MNLESVCIIILNWNEKELLQDCLDSIFKNTSYDNFEVIVVDNGSSDGSVSMIQERYPNVELLCNETNLGFAIGNNQAISENSNFDNYVLLNNDVKVHSGWLEEMVKTSEYKKSIKIVGAKLLYPDGTIQHAGARFSLIKDFHIGRGESKNKYTVDRPVDYVTGAAFLIDSEVIKTIGYLDEIFSPVYYEEADYCQRAKKSGYEIYYSANSIITHYESRTAESTPSEFKTFVNRKNVLKYALLNESIMRLTIVIVYFFWKTINSILRRDNPKAHIKSLREVIVDLPQIISKRYNRTDHIPSYYCDNIKNYMERYK